MFRLAAQPPATSPVTAAVALLATNPAMTLATFRARSLTGFPMTTMKFTMTKTALTMMMWQLACPRTDFDATRAAA
jgi:hypothetical protein